ncbi:MAG: RecQ family ATP-dependent DNA helicase, partial [Phycisphaerales bacterium]|nr:RecQ family ATP-dependent DNA helicase [Phycisphaerales bacterium]
LIALMKDQVDGMKLAGYPAAALHSGVSANEQADIRRKLAAGELRLLLVAPERLLGGTDESGGTMGSALLTQLTRLDATGALGGFAIDEAHCISQWGHDFRPEYRRLSELRTVFPDAPIQAYTATATPQVRDDIIHALDLRDPAILVGCFDRPNLTYRILPRVGTGDQQIADILRRHDGNAAIVYCMSRKETERLAGLLSLQGIKSEAYHAGLDHSKRHRVQEDFLNDRLNVVCATVAFGMGIDRGDVRCVIHAASPKSVEAYQQETGRAGRDGLPAECVLLYSSADEVRWCQLVDRSAAESEIDVSPEVIAAQKELIKQMHSLAKGAQCRHKALSEHFGQAYMPPADDVTGGPGIGCGACDVCLQELDEIDGSQTIAQKIVSCVARLRGTSGLSAYGSAYVVDVLRGSGQAKILERRHHELSTFGLLRDMPKDVLASCVAQLVDAGALEREPGEFPVLTLGPKAAAVLKGTHPVRLLRQKSAPEEAADRKRGGRQREAFGTPSVKLDLSADERALFDHLRQLRKDIAAGMGMPPYVVFGDTALEEMARVRPGSLSSFASIRGVGQAKLEQFGDRFVAAVSDYCRGHGLALDAAAGSRPRPALAERSQADGAAAAPLSAGSKNASAMFDRGSSVEEVCAATGRAPSTVRGYLEDYVREAKPASIGAWVDTKTYERVVQAFERTGSFALKPAFEELGGEVAYDTIRLVLTHKRISGASR